MPQNQPQGAELIKIVQHWRSLRENTGSKTGLWYQIVDNAVSRGNWLETSSSSMYTYMMDGCEAWLPGKALRGVAQKGFEVC